MRKSQAVRWGELWRICSVNIYSESSQGSHRSRDYLLVLRRGGGHLSDGLKRKEAGDRKGSWGVPPALSVPALCGHSLY